MNYRLFGSAGVAPEEQISRGLKNIIESANEQMRTYPQHHAEPRARFGVEKIRSLANGESIKALIVEAIRKSDKIMFDAYGGSWLMFSDVFFDDGVLEFRYKPNAASVIRALAIRGESE